MNLTAVFGRGWASPTLAGLWASVEHGELLGSRNPTKSTRIANQIGPTVGGVELSDEIGGTVLVTEALQFHAVLRLDAVLLHNRTLISALKYHAQWNG